MLSRKDKEHILETVRSCRSASSEDVKRVRDALEKQPSSSFSSGLILKTNDVADMLGITVFTVRELANQGILKVHYGCGCKRWSGIVKESVEEFLKNPKHHMRKAKK